MNAQKRPHHTQKRPNHTQEKPIYTQKRPMQTKKRPVYTKEIYIRDLQKRPIKWRTQKGGLTENPTETYA